MGAGEMAAGMAALPEDQDAVPAPAWCLITFCNHSPRGSGALFWPQWMLKKIDYF